MDVANLASITVFRSFRPPHEFTAAELDSVKRGDDAAWPALPPKRERTRFVWTPPLASSWGIGGSRHSLGADYRGPIEIPPLPPIQPFEDFERETERELHPPKKSNGKGNGGEPQAEGDIDREERDLEHRIVEAPALVYDPEPQRKWIVEDVVPDETLTLVTGEGGIGKTTLALQLAVAMRIDGDWLGMKVTQGTVLFVSSEDDRKDVNLNLRAILKAEHKSLAHCPDLYVLSLADRDACLGAASTKLGAIEATPLWHALVRLVERRKPRIVIFDALADLFGGEENVRRHARGFIVLLKQLAIRQKLAVILISHPSLSGMNTGSGLSGSTDWHNGPRARLYFERPKDKDDKAVDVDLRTLTVKKVQYAQEGTAFRLRRKAGFFVYEGRDGGSTFDRAASAAKAETVFLSLLHAFEDQGRSVSPNPSGSFAPVVFEREADADGVSKAALGRAMSKLLQANRIHIETSGPPSHQRKKLAPGPAPTANPANETVQ
jgi:RecA-family ATPase